jgi:hypothetical protein
MNRFPLPQTGTHRLEGCSVLIKAHNSVYIVVGRLSVLSYHAFPRGDRNHLTINLGDYLGYLSDNSDYFTGQMRSTIGRGKNCEAE